MIGIEKKIPSENDKARKIVFQALSLRVTAPDLQEDANAEQLSGQHKRRLP